MIDRVIALPKNSVFHAKKKHIDVRYHFVHDCVADQRLDLVKIHTSENPTNELTKSLSNDGFQHCRELMGVTYLSFYHQYWTMFNRLE